MLLTMKGVKLNWEGWTPLQTNTVPTKWYLSRLVQQESEEVHTEIAGERTVRDKRLGLDLQ